MRERLAAGDLDGARDAKVLAAREYDGASESKVLPLLLLLRLSCRVWLCVPAASSIS